MVDPFVNKLYFSGLCLEIWLQYFNIIPCMLKSAPVLPAAKLSHSIMLSPLYFSDEMVFSDSQASSFDVQT